MKNILFVAALIISSRAFGQSAVLPAWYLNSFHKNGLDKKYSIKLFLKPSYLVADFNGDGVKDIAATIAETKSHKKGILIICGNSDKYDVLGAGSKFGKRGEEYDNISWANGWQLYKKRFDYETVFAKDGDIKGYKKVRLLNTAISIWSSEDGHPIAGGDICWNGKRYLWIHTGE